MDDGDLVLKVRSPKAPVEAARDLGGWQSIRITRGAEQLPNDFDVEISSPFRLSLTVQPQDVFEAFIGEEIVMSGYIDGVSPTIDAGQHSIQVEGRSKCQDLVDCSAEWPSSQISGTNALEVAQKLAGVYGIKVSSDVSGQPRIPQFNFTRGETPFDILERICRYSALLLYELADGSLFLTQIGKVSASGVLQEGANIQSGTIKFTANERYSHYAAYLLPLNVFGDIPSSATGGAFSQVAEIDDPSVYRRRSKFIVAETVGGQKAPLLAQARLLWEAARRLGRSQAATITVSTWRDAAGKLWEPNTLIDIVSPALGIDTVSDGEKWVIGRVTYSRDASGTSAILSVMPKVAYLPQPALIQPLVPDVPRFDQTTP